MKSIHPEPKKRHEAPALVWGARICRFGVGALLLVAGGIKIGHPVGMAEAIARYRLVGEQVAQFAGYYLPWVEVFVGGVLLAGSRRSGAWLLAMLLAAVFLAAVGTAWARGLDISCGCFATGKSIDVTTLTTNVALLLGTGLGWYLDSRSRFIGKE